MLALPLWYRRRVARNGRAESKENQRHLRPEIMDVTPQEVVKVMQHYQVNQLIHGHTHRPAIHELTVNDAPAKRIVLGDWYDQGSVLLVTPEAIDLQSRVFRTTL